MGRDMRPKYKPITCHFIFLLDCTTTAIIIYFQWIIIIMSLHLQSSLNAFYVHIYDVMIYTYSCNIKFKYNPYEGCLTCCLVMKSTITIIVCSLFVGEASEGT